MAVDGNLQHIVDIVNPPRMFVGGKRQSSQAAPKLKLSAQLTGEYAGRQSIRDMFSKVTAQKTSDVQGVKKASINPPTLGEETGNLLTPQAHDTTADSPSTQGDSESLLSAGSGTDCSNTQTNPSSQPREPPAKRQKVVSSPGGKKFSNTTLRKSSSRGQQSLINFFKKPSPAPETVLAKSSSSQQSTKGSTASLTSNSGLDQQPIGSSFSDEPPQVNDEMASETGDIITQPQRGDSFPSIDPIASKEKWSQLFTKPIVPRCDAHSEPCILRVTKKPGPNVGRAFWMCSRFVPIFFHTL